MARFEQLVVSNHRDRFRIPRVTDVVIVNVDEVTTVEDATVDLTYRGFFDPDCPRSVFPGVKITLRDGTCHTLMLGQYDTDHEADTELDRFTQWLTGISLLT